MGGPSVNGPSYPTAPRPTTYQDGLEFQDFVCEVLARRHIILQNLQSKVAQLKRGENLQGFEIKLDQRCTETGRISIEVAEKADAKNPSWVPSGIHRGDNTWLYIQGNSQVLFIFDVGVLRRYEKKIKPKYHESYGTVRKFYISMDMARQIASKTVDIRPTESTPRAVAPEEWAPGSPMEKLGSQEDLFGR